MKETQRKLLKYIAESGGDGVDVSQVSEAFGIEESTAYKRLAVLRKHDWAKRIRDDGELVHVITDKGKKALELTGQNPKVKSNKSEVRTMAVSVKISDDICEELDALMEEEGLSSYAEAVDFALADYFDLLEEEETEEAESLEER